MSVLVLELITRFNTLEMLKIEKFQVKLNI